LWSEKCLSAGLSLVVWRKSCERLFFASSSAALTLHWRHRQRLKRASIKTFMDQSGPLGVRREKLPDFLNDILRQPEISSAPRVPGYEALGPPYRAPPTTTPPPVQKQTSTKPPPPRLQKRTLPRRWPASQPTRTRSWSTRATRTRSATRPRRTTRSRRRCC